MDVNTVAVESSPAAAETFAPPARGSEAYNEWRKTGKVPATPKPEASAASKHASKESSGAPGEEPGAEATASEADVSKAGERKPQQRRDNAASRLAELLEDLKNAGFTPAELKTFKREQQKQESAPASQQAKDAPAPSDELKAPTKPELKDFDDYGKYEAALEKYHEELADYRVEKKLRERDAQQRIEAAQRSAKEKLDAATKRYGSEAAPKIEAAAKELNADRQITPVVKALVDDSPVIADLLYTLSSDAGEWASFLDLSRTNPGQAVRKLVLVEKLVTEELAKTATAAAAGGSEATPQRGEDGKFVSDKAPAKKTTNAPPPPTEASGRTGTVPDEVETAVKGGDFRSFRETQNRRDLARQQGR